MKTTNFFIDYLVIGVIFVLGLLLPVYIFDPDYLDAIISYSTKDRPYMLPLLTVFLYISGIIFNQLSDVFLSKAGKLLGLGKIQEEENLLNDIVEGGYHVALQKVVITSQSAYDFLSFRRSIIRIFRSLVVMLLLSLASSIIIEIIDSSACDLSTYYIFAACFFLLIFVRYRIIKLQVGYYKAIANFYVNCEDKS
ncbi:MAG: hypothetical protein LGR52_07665 [Candidatus Thiosymbion ectosymbiont of Robbea hypermnestra]|nr:hypothetical protein [Candidatus Thiosymbion ectosymbiont of Robbea hypermnestra]